MPVATSATQPSAGGFLLEPSATQRLSIGAGSSDTSGAPAAPLRLSPGQVTRLRSHLDDLILSINRRFAKRFHRHEDGHSSQPASDSVATASQNDATQDSAPPPLDTLSKYVGAWTQQVLPLVAKIDPVGAQQTATVLAYAMSITDAVAQGVLGYELLTSMEGPASADAFAELNGSVAAVGQDQAQSSHNGTSGDHRPVQAEDPLHGVMCLFHLLDAFWASLLVGRRLDVAAATRRAHARLSPASSSNAADRSLRDSTSLQGSLGTRTASVTDRVRLRNLLVARRADVQAWLASQAGVELPASVLDEYDEVGLRNQPTAPVPPLPPMRGERGIKRPATEDASERPQNDQSRGRTRREVDVLEQSSQQNESKGKRPRRGLASRKLSQFENACEASGPRDGIVEAFDEVEDTKLNRQGSSTPVESESIKREMEDSEEEAELEEVAVPGVFTNGADPEDPGADGDTNPEHQHFRRLFERKLNPDDDSDEDEEDNEDQHEDIDGNERVDIDDAFQRRPSRLERVIPADGDAGGEVTAAETTQTSAALGEDHLQARETMINDNAGATTTTTTSTVTTMERPRDALEVQALSTRLFSRTLALLERLESL